MGSLLKIGVFISIGAVTGSLLGWLGRCTGGG
jgi:hypothetical protein